MKKRDSMLYYMSDEYLLDTCRSKLTRHPIRHTVDGETKLFTYAEFYHKYKNQWADKKEYVIDGR